MPPISAHLAIALVSAAALAGQAAAQPAPAPPSVRCVTAYVIAVGATPQAPLTVTLNDELVGAYDGYGAPELDSLMKPGLNTVVFSYPAAGNSGTQAELWCRAVAGGDARIVLNFRPTAGRLSARMNVNFTGPP